MASALKKPSSRGKIASQTVSYEETQQRRATGGSAGASNYEKVSETAAIGTKSSIQPATDDASHVASPMRNSLA